MNISTLHVKKMVRDNTIKHAPLTLISNLCDENSKRKSTLGKNNLELYILPGEEFHLLGLKIRFGLCKKKQSNKRWKI